MSLEKRRVSVTLTKRLTDILDGLVTTGAYLNQGEVFRAGLRLICEKHGITFPIEEVEGL